MNIRAGWALVKSTWTSWMQYRGFFFVLAFGWMIPPLVYLFVWSSAAAGNEIGGLNRGEFVAYYLILILVNQLTYSQSNWTVGDMIREGLINTWLLRPMAPIFHVLSGEIAGKVVTLAFVIPLSALLALLLKPEIHTTPQQGVLFFIALFLSWALRFLWGFWLALLAFWATRADALLALQDALVFLLAGMIAPVQLLPLFLQDLARLLPFRYMVGFPVEILVQPLSPFELILGFTCQIFWLILALLASWLAWKTGLKRYSSVGG